MRRSVLIVAALLAAGAALNTGVAVALFATGEQIRIRRHQFMAPDASGRYVQTHPMTCSINDVSATEDRLPPFLHPEGDVSGWQAPITPGRWVGVAPGSVRSATGWPLPALRHVPPPIGSVAPPAPGAPPPRWFAMTHGRMPRHIYWPGFATNTLIYAAALMPLLALYPVRGAVRARRGRCPRCGYDVRGLQTCPECGAARRQPAPTAVEDDAR